MCHGLGAAITWRATAATEVLVRAKILACLALLMAAPAWADEASDRATIQHTYDQLRASLARQSMEPLEAAYARDAVIVGENGVAERHVAPPSATLQFAAGKRQEGSEVRVVRVGLGGDVATAVVSIRILLSVPTGGVGRYQSEVVMDVIHDWRRTTEGWRIQRETTVSTRTVTGMASLDAAIKANVRASVAQNGGSAANNSQVIDRIHSAMAMGQLRAGYQMQIQQGWNDNAALRGLRGALYGP